MKHLSSIRGAFVLLVAALIISGCTTVDDYLLGKDNSLPPTPIKPIHSRYVFAKDWSAYVGSSTVKDTAYKIRPVVREGVIYTVSTGGQISAIREKNGAIVWAKKFPNILISGPTVSDSQIYVTDAHSHLMALNRSTGDMIWKKTLSSTSFAKPLIVRDLAIVKTMDGRLYAFDTKTGTKRWEDKHGAPSLVLKASATPAILDEKTIIVPYADGKIDALNVTNGEVLWSRTLVFNFGASDLERLVDIDSDPIVRGQHIFLASYQGYVGEWSLKNGDFIWKKPASTFKNFLVAGDEFVYTDSDDVVWALDKNTGAVLWKQVDLKARGVTEPILWNGHIVVGDKEGYLHVLTKSSGKIVARAKIDGAVYQSPLVVDNALAVQTENGLLIRLKVS